MLCVSQNKSPWALQNCGQLKHQHKINCQCFTASSWIPWAECYVWNSGFWRWVPFLTASVSFASVLYISFQAVYFFCPVFSGADSLFWNFQPNSWTSYHCPWKHSSPVWVWHCRSLTSASADFTSIHSHSVALMFSCWPPHLYVVLTHSLKMFSV